MTNFICHIDILFVEKVEILRFRKIFAENLFITPLLIP